jgi:hypothetical protein
MVDYMKKHESYVAAILEKASDEKQLRELLVYHDKQIRWMQHERLVHLIVMLFVCLFMLLALGYAITHMSAATLSLTALLVLLSVGYIIHYYRLENGVQRWYLISNRIRKAAYGETDETPNG